MEYRPARLVDVQRTAFLSVSRASLACKARGMASRHAFQNLVLTHEAWKRTAGRDYRFTVNGIHSCEVARDSYPCLGAPNHERTIHDLMLALQNEGPLLHQRLVSSSLTRVCHLQVGEVSQPGIFRAICPKRPPVESSASRSLSPAKSLVCFSLFERQRATCRTCDACFL